MKNGRVFTLSKLTPTRLSLESAFIFGSVQRVSLTGCQLHSGGCLRVQLTLVLGWRWWCVQGGGNLCASDIDPKIQDAELASVENNPDAIKLYDVAVKYV